MKSSKTTTIPPQHCHSSVLEPPHPTDDGFVGQVRELAHSVESHPAVDNPFYDLWMSKPLNPAQVELFAKNYREWIRPTVDRIARAIVSMKDLRSRAVSVENIRDELGGGDEEKAHVHLLDTFLDELLTRVYGRPFAVADSNAPVLPTTERLNMDGMKIFEGQPPLAAGGLLAQEWHAYPQLVKLYEGARHYKDLGEPDRFHDVCGYFYIHIGEAEKNHMEQSVVSAARSCVDLRDLQLLRKGCHDFLGLLAGFWQGLYDAIIVAG